MQLKKLKFASVSARVGPVLDSSASPIAPGLNAGDFGERSLGCYVVAASSPLAIMPDLKQAATVAIAVLQLYWIFISD